MGLLKYVEPDADDSPTSQPIRRNKSSRSNRRARREATQRNNVSSGNGTVGETEAQMKYTAPSSKTSSVIHPQDYLSSPEEETSVHTARANQTSIASTSSLPRRPPIPSDSRSSKSTPSATTIVAPVPIVPIGAHMIPTSTSPEPAVWADLAPSVTRDILAALPSPALTASVAHQRSQRASQQNSLSSAGKGSVDTSESETEAHKKRKPPSEWIVDEVVEWLKSKGFESEVYDRFIEQEITGEVLLELDLNLLKAEIGIMAFGKRMRIANAIAELRRPSSIILPDHQPQHGPSIAQSVSQSFSYAHSSSGSTQRSLNSPMFASMESMLNGPPSSVLAGGLVSLESPKTETFASQVISKRVSSLSSAGTSMNGDGSVEGAIVAGGNEKASLVSLRAMSEMQMSSSPSDSTLTAPEESPDETADEHRVVQNKDETAPAGAKQDRLLGLSVDLHGSGEDKERSEIPSEAKPPPSGTGGALCSTV